VRREYGVLDAGAEKGNGLGESFEVVSEATGFAVRTALQEAGTDYVSAEANFVPPMRSSWTSVPLAPPPRHHRRRHQVRPRASRCS
jgi:hypothetical protein